MISSVKFTVRGSNYNSVLVEAERKWQEFISDSSATIPYESEIAIAACEDGEYSADVTVRVRANRS